MQGDFFTYTLTGSKGVLLLLSVAILLRCLRSMLREKYDPETWAYLRYGRDRFPVQHWEVIIGRAPDSDVCIPLREVARTHAILRRNEHGDWRIYDVFGRGGVWVDNIFVDDDGAEIHDGDEINLNGIILKFSDLSMERREKLESKRTGVGRRYSPGLTLLMLTVFQLFLLLQHSFFADPANLPDIALGFCSLIVMEWRCFNAMRIINRSGFEIETLAFYLSSLGMSVAASSTPEDLYKQILLTLAGLILFLLCGWWQRSLHRTARARIPVALAALLLLGINVVASDVVLGARNWLEFWGFSFQPSEIVKVAYVYVGAATLDRLFRRNNLYLFIAFSAICVMALALIGDFGTALVFFICFLVISFMRSGSVATVMLAVTGAVLAGFLAVSARPYIAQRFASWGHVWEDIYDKGFQQTRAMSAAAASQHFRRQHRPGVRHDLRGAGPHHRAVHGGGRHPARMLRRAQRAQRPQRLLRHRFLRRDEHPAHAARAERVRFDGYSALHGRYLPLCVARRLVAAVVLDDDGLPQERRHPARGQLCGAPGRDHPLRRGPRRDGRGTGKRQKAGARGARPEKQEEEVPDMKKLNRRALSVMLIALFIVLGLFTYVQRYVKDGEYWASYFSRLNSLSEGYVTDRYGVMLAAFTANDNRFNEDRSTRIANYHVTGDFWDRTGTGILTGFSRQLHSYSPITGMTQTRTASLKLNVDSALNKKAYAALAERRGAVGVVNYRTGEMICLVSSPAIDPTENDPVAPEGVYINRLLSASFTPGSIFKLVTAAAAIECVPSIWQRSFFCEGEDEISGVIFHCPFEHYTNDFAGALANSCNIAFAKIAISVGQREMVNHVRDYGFLDGHELDGIPTAAGSYPLDYVGDPETGWSGIGQSTDLICPYSMLRFVAAIANDGMLIEPKLIDDGKPPEKTMLVNPETAKTMQRLMRNNVVQVYGDNRFPGLTVCGKTGTAEVGDGTDHAWFTGFLQDEEHPYAFIAFVEHGGGGLSVAVPIANTVLQAAVRRGTDMDFGTGN